MRSLFGENYKNVIILFLVIALCNFREIALCKFGNRKFVIKINSKTITASSLRFGHLIEVG